MKTKCVFCKTKALRLGIKFCSLSCYNRYRSEIKKKICHNCGTVFSTNAKMFCSRRCMSEGMLMEKNRAWKGDKVGYKGLHKRINKKMDSLGVYKKCVQCGSKDNIDLSNISGEYRQDIHDWRYLCRRCHFRGDKRFEIFEHFRNNKKK